MNYFEFISNSKNAFDFAVMLFLSAVKLSILFGNIYIICRLFRHFSAAIKHFILMSGLCAGLLVPFLSSVKSWEIPILPAQISSINQQFQADVPFTAEKSEQESNSSKKPFPPVEKSLFTTDPEIVQQINFQRRLDQISVLIILIWLTGAVFLLFRLVIGIFTANLYTRRARTVVDPALTKLVAETSQDLNLTGKVRPLVSEHISVPVICGLWRSKVLLPESFEAWTEEQQGVVLLHELAHIKRRDCLTQLLAQIVCALYWFNPIVWYAARHLRELREQACDDYVLNAGTKPSVYADHLLQIARSMQDKRSLFNLTQTATVAIARKSQIETRLLSILDPSQSRRGLSRFITAGSIFSVAIIALPLSALQIKSQPGDLAGLTDTTIGSPEESEHKIFPEIENHLTVNRQNNSWESSEINRNKKVRTSFLNGKKNNFENAETVEIDISKEQNSRLKQRVNFDNSKSKVNFSDVEISAEDEKSSGLTPLSGLKLDLGSLDRLKSDLKSKDPSVRRKALSETDRLRTQTVLNN